MAERLQHLQQRAVADETRISEDITSSVDVGWSNGTLEIYQDVMPRQTMPRGEEAAKYLLRAFAKLHADEAPFNPEIHVLGHSFPKTMPAEQFLRLVSGAMASEWAYVVSLKEEGFPRMSWASVAIRDN